MMHSPQKVFDLLASSGFEFFTGVPDSLLKDFCAYVTENTNQDQHVIAANEGNAIGLAIGHYLGTNKPALVYMQNSGIGNAVNPLLSLADKEIYKVPMLLMIGWRGEPGVSDEPQHVKQGRIMKDLLKTMEIPSFEVSRETEDLDILLNQAVQVMKDTSAPVALLVSKGSFEKYGLSPHKRLDDMSTREDAIEQIVSNLEADDFVVSTTGMASRELYEVRDRNGQSHANDFLTVGGMGHASSIALGLARAVPERKIFCIDGDGAALMHMGAFGITGAAKLHNLVHILINNGAHDSVGGQPTVGLDIDFQQIAGSSGYAFCCSASNHEEISEMISQARTCGGPSLIEIKVKPGSRKDLGRPLTTPRQNLELMMDALGTNQ